MSKAGPLDDRGRFTIDPQYRKLLGEAVIQIWTPHGLLLRPVDAKLRKKHFPGAAEASGEEEAMREVEERRKRPR